VCCHGIHGKFYAIRHGVSLKVAFEILRKVFQTDKIRVGLFLVSDGDGMEGTCTSYNNSIDTHLDTEQAMPTAELRIKKMSMTAMTHDKWLCFEHFMLIYALNDALGCSFSVELSYNLNYDIPSHVGFEVVMM
jgi:hypothetical protein